MASSQMVCRAFLAVMIVLLAACSTYTKPGRESPPAEESLIETPPKPVTPPASTDKQTPPRSVTPSASAAWQPLLTKAEQAADRGDYEQALALSERAQRIDPDSAEVYLRMAEIHWAKGDKIQARVTAERGLLYCSSQAVCDALRAYSR